MTEAFDATPARATRSGRKAKRKTRGRAQHDRAFTDIELAKPTPAPMKVFDRECRGLYAFLSPGPDASLPPRIKFNFRYREKELTKNAKTGKLERKQPTIPVGVGGPHFGVTEARQIGYELAAKAVKGERLKHHLQQEAHAASVSGLTFDELCAKYLLWLQVPVRKADQAMRPRKESWAQVEGRLKRPRELFGTYLARDVTGKMIKTMLNALVEADKAATSINTRRALIQLFKWAADSDRELVPFSPCTALGPLPKVVQKITKNGAVAALEVAHIQTLWRGLDREDVVGIWPRHVRLGLKGMLATMLRPTELLTALKPELTDWARPDRTTYDIPMHRVKKRRNIYQPINSLAREVFAELLTMPESPRCDTKGLVFPAGPNGGHVTLKSLGEALRGRTSYKMVNVKPNTIGKKGLGGADNRKARKTYRTPGICELLGLPTFSPYALRRTTATLLEMHDVPRPMIGRCLDHIGQVEEGAAVASKHYIKLARAAEIRKRQPTLNLLDELLRAIIKGDFDADEIIAGGKFMQGTRPARPASEFAPYQYDAGEEDEDDDTVVPMPRRKAA